MIKILILKDGKLHKHKFICHICGCEFVANKNEYKHNTQYQLTGCYDALTNKPQMERTEQFCCYCPVCGNLVEDVLTTTNVDKLKEFCKSWECDKEL